MDRWQLINKLATTSPSVRRAFMQKIGQAAPPNGAPANGAPAAAPPNGAQPPAGAAPQVDPQALIGGLGEAFSAEINAAATYATFSACATGSHREYLKSYWMEEAKEELGHAQIIGEKICVMGGQPAVQGIQPADVRTNSAMIQQALQMETQAVGLYAQLAQQAEQSGMHGLKVVIEEILADEQNHLDNTALMAQDLEHQDPNQSLATQVSGQFDSINNGGGGASRQSFPPAAQMAPSAPVAPAGPAPQPGPPPGPPQA